MIWLLRCSAVTALASIAAGVVMGAMPSQTMGGFGEPIFALPLPTPAPEMELVKKRLGKKDATNICAEWTIPGGYGQPECVNSETCLFTSAGGYYYEGCGQTSKRYDWNTECWDYPQSGTAPLSQVYCPETAPYCGFFAFVFGVDYTFWNFGCSIAPYSLFVDLLPSTTRSYSSAVVLAGGGTSQITPTAATVQLTQQPSYTRSVTGVLLPPGMTPNRAQTSSTTTVNSNLSQTPTTNPQAKSSTPIGAIVGGSIGGIAVLAFLSFLLWFCLRKRRQNKAFAEAAARNEQQQADAATAIAFHNHTRISEIGGTPKPMAEYIQPSSPGWRGSLAKQTADANAVESQYSPNSIPSPPLSQMSYARQEQREEIHELGGTARESWNVPQGGQGLSDDTAGIARKPVGALGSGSRQYTDMSGTPINEDFR